MFGRVKCVTPLIFVLLCVSECECKRYGRSAKDKNDGKSSLAFVFDITGSMYNDLRQVREGAEMILNTALKDGDVIADFVFVPFHDPAVGPATVTQSKEVFKKALNIVRVYGGGDCPEKSLTGIQLALNVSRPRSFLYVFTDATAIDHRIVGKVLDTIQRKQSQVVFILTGHCNDLDKPSYKVYQQVAAASSGQIFNLNKTSVHKMLEFVKSSIKGRTVNLASVSNPAGYNYTQEIPVDSTLGEVTVSVSGAKPQITVIDPNGEPVTGPPKLVTTLDLSEIMVVKVMQPEAGNWRITVGSEEDYSVKVVGLSNLTFNHGFSATQPESMHETSYRPLKGTYNHLMISLSQTNVSADIQYAEVLTLSGKTLFELPLTVADPAAKVYRADPFIPPDEFFYIAINGRDQYKQELRRIGATAIQAKLPDIPYLTVPQKVEAPAHSRVVLSCDIESLVPVNAMWTKDASRIQKQISSLQTTLLDVVIEDMKEENVGTYKCVARNVAGLSQATTELTIIVDPPQVTIEPENITVEVGDNITITCAVYSEALLLEYRLIFNGTQSNYTIDINRTPNIEAVYTYNKTIRILENDTGLYSCVAANRGGKTNQSTRISVRLNPSAQILGPHSLTKHIHSDFQLVCSVDNAEAVVWTGPKDTKIKRIKVNGIYNDVLDVQNVTDNGIWTCIAMRDSRNDSDSVHVEVLIKPVVAIKGAKNITVLNGTTIEVICEVVAKPKPRILWHRETENFLTNTITKMNSTIYRSVLTLNSSAETVNGTYFCFGENSEGIHQDSVIINVRRKMSLVKEFGNQSVQLYSQVKLECVVDSYPLAVTRWYHNGTLLVVSNNIHMSDDNTTLYLKRVDFCDLGKYSCEAQNAYEKVEVNGTIDVTGLAPPVISKELNRFTAREGTPTKIPCRMIQGHPIATVSWQYRTDNSTQFSPPPKDVVVNMERFELTIHKVSKEHGGIYRCVATNVIGQDSFEATLVVQYPPELVAVTEEKLQQEIREGDKLQLSCEASGFPPPVIVWTKDGRALVFTDKLSLTKEGDLVIKKASAYDSGIFTCNVTSALGSTQRNYTLIVYEPPTITSTADLVQDILEGQLVELPCTAQGVPTPVVEWTQNGAPIQNGKYSDDFGLRFVANLTDFGEYTCMASNGYGNSSVTYMLQVWVPPYIVPASIMVKEVLLGSNVSMQCDVIGFPVPSIRWKFADELLTENNTDLSFNNVGNIYIYNVSSKHEGVYVCVGENLGGVAEQPLHLKVNEPPKIIEDNYTGPYLATNVDTVLSIACSATGSPKPYILWAKDDFYLNKDGRYSVDTDGTLHIASPSEDMSGDYTCVARNSVGQANKTVTVLIYSIPTAAHLEESQGTVTLVEGSDAELQCPVHATSHSLKWYKHAQLISTEPLRLYNVSRHNASTYSCVVSNAVGSAHAKVKVLVEWPPRFVEDKDGDIEKVRGDDCYIHCDVDAKPIAKTKWIFNSKPLVFEDKSSLKLINVQIHNTGAYKCIVSNIHGTVVKDFTLKVLEPPFISDFDMMDVQLKEGDNATLECNARGTPTPTVQWTYNNTNWFVDNTSLSAVKITSQYQGLYRCNAFNSAGNSHIVYRVTVVFPAKVQDILAFIGGDAHNIGNVVEVVHGSSARIACKASGNPIPDIQWLKQGRVVSENRYDIDYADLTLNTVESSHGGLYTCVASNEGGSEQRRVKLDVLESPNIFQSLFETSNSTETVLEVISGQSFYLHCHPYGNPIPEVYWFKNDVPLKLFDDTMVATEFGEVIVVKQALEQQSGNYTCVARNKVGNTSVSYLVEVLVPPPAPKESSRKVTVGVGKQLTLVCPSMGTEPTAMWVKQPYTEVNNDSRVLLADDNFTLIINKTEISDSGKYSCILTNKVGTTEITFDVVIQKAPSIAGNVGTNIVEGHVVPMRRSIVLKCEANGHPMPRITWLKDTQELSESVSNIQRVLGNSLLAIWSVTARDAGQYICVAENQAGTAHRRYNVAIQVPAKWSSWSAWSLCNVSCGLGHQIRGRRCHYVDDNNNIFDSSTETIILDETSCRGPSDDKRKCHMPPCEVDETKPHWSQWSRWSECSATCGAGTQARTRRCRTKAKCSGDNVQIRKCSELPACNSSGNTSDTDVYDSKEYVNETNSYLPEMIFEMQPEVINSHYSSDVEEIYSASGSQSPTVYFDIDVSDNLDGSERGPCDPGYSHNVSANTCDDVDECLVETNQCHRTQVCANSPGAYRCSCPAGYLALAAGQRCIDINECELETDGCEYSCVNTAGGYVCACPRHLRLHLDKHHCVIPSLYRRPYNELESEYLSTTIDFPTKYTKAIRNT